MQAIGVGGDSPRGPEDKQGEEEQGRAGMSCPPGDGMRFASAVLKDSAHKEVPERCVLSGAGYVKIVCQGRGCPAPGCRVLTCMVLMHRERTFPVARRWVHRGPEAAVNRLSCWLERSGDSPALQSKPPCHPQQKLLEYPEKGALPRAQGCGRPPHTWLPQQAPASAARFWRTGMT